MKRDVLMAFTILSAMSLLVFPVFNFVAFAEPPTVPPLGASLDSRYHKVSLLNNWPDETDFVVFDISEETFIMHGWMTAEDPDSEHDLPHWSEMTPKQKNDFLKSASFTLEVDGDPVSLYRYQWYHKPSDTMWVTFWATFPANYFEYGNILEGYWSVTFEGDQFVHFEDVQVVEVPP